MLLKELATIIKPGITKNTRTPSDVIALASNNITNTNGICFEEVRYVTPHPAKDAELIRHGDILAVIAGPDIGKIAVYGLPMKAVTTSSMVIIRPNNNSLEKKLKQLQARIMLLEPTGTTLPRITVKQLENLEL